MSDTVKYLLDESRIPKNWYNLMADLPTMVRTSTACAASSNPIAPVTTSRIAATTATPVRSSRRNGTRPAASAR